MRRSLSLRNAQEEAKEEEDEGITRQVLRGLLRISRSEGSPTKSIENEAVLRTSRTAPPAIHFRERFSLADRLFYQGYDYLDDVTHEGRSGESEGSARRPEAAKRLRQAHKTLETEKVPDESEQWPSRETTEGQGNTGDALPFSLEDYLAFDAESREAFEQKVRKQSDMSDKAKQMSLYAHPYVVRGGGDALVKRAVTTRLIAHSKTSRISKFHAPNPYEPPSSAPAAVISDANRWIDRHWISSAQAALRISDPGPLPWKMSRVWKYDPIRSEWTCSDHKSSKISPSIIDRSEYLSGRLWRKDGHPSADAESEIARVQNPWVGIMTRKQIINRISFPDPGHNSRYEFGKRTGCINVKGKRFWKKNAPEPELDTERDLCVLGKKKVRSLMFDSYVPSTDSSQKT